jgi:hypothetical protein
MLHIHNGESSANTLQQSTIRGEQFAFREALIAGPTPGGLASEDWRKIRAQHLSDAYGVDSQECERDLLLQEKTLASFPDHEEVVLWFEHDLFCQVNLIYLLDWFAQRSLGKTKLSLICIGEFPGKANFRGLGELTADQLASLVDSRHEVTPAELNLATAAWKAYCSTDPTVIEELLGDDTSALPFLRNALRGHLARFPSVKNGLGRIENCGLELIHSGLKEFGRLFPKFGDAEPVYGLGDFQFWLALKRLGDAREPLLDLPNRSATNGKLDSDKVRQIAFEITEKGEAVLKGEADFVKMNGIDLWLGGVHLSGNHHLWRWDEAKRNLINA